MRLVILILLFLTASSSDLRAQSLIQGEPSKALEMAAQQTTDMWQRELAMSNKQAALMKINLIEFAMKREELLQMNLPAEEKTRRLIALEVLEDKDLRDILTRLQFDRYIILKQKKLEEASPMN